MSGVDVDGGDYPQHRGYFQPTPTIQPVGENRRRRMAATLCLTAFFLAGLGLSVAAAQEPSDIGLPLPWLQANSGLYFDDGNHQGRAAATLFAPIARSPGNLLFGQLDDGFLFGGAPGRGGLTIGYRHQFHHFIFGTNAGLDIDNSAAGNTFTQATFGLEALGTDFDARSNIYLPLSGAKSSPSLATINLSGTSIAMVGAEEVPLLGFDAAAGHKLYASSDDRHQIWAHLGGYYFGDPGGTGARSFGGPQYGLEFRIDDPFGIGGSRLTLGVGGRWDRQHGNRLMAGLGFRVTLGGPSSTTPDSLDSHLSDPVLRSHEIALGQSREAVKDELTGVTLNQVAYSTRLAAGDLGSAVTAAGQNTLLIVNENYASPQTISNGANLTVAGAGATLTLAGVTSGVVTAYTLPGSRPAISASGSGGDLTALTLGGSGNSLGQNVHIDGLDITAENSAISGTSQTTGILATDLSAPVYLDDLSVLARGTISSSGASDSHVHALYALNDFSGADTTPFVNVLNSDFEARFSGDFNGSAAATTSSEVRVYGIRSHDAQINIENSTLHAYSDANLTGGLGTGSNAVLGLYGIRSSGQNATTNLSNSTLSAEFAGTLAANNTPIPKTKSTLLAYGLFDTGKSATVNDSSLVVKFDGSLDTTSSAELYAFEYQYEGLLSGVQSLTLANSTLSVTGSNSASWSAFNIISEGIRLDAITPLTATAVMSGNTFSGLYGTLVGLSSGYTIGAGSTANTASGAAATTVCYDGGTSWSGSFVLDGTTYTTSNCTH